MATTENRETVIFDKMGVCTLFQTFRGPLIQNGNHIIVFFTENSKSLQKKNEKD